MQKISKISRQKKHTSRYNIFLNGTYSFSVSEEVLIQFQLSKGKELTEETIKAIEESESWQYAYSNALYYLQFRMRTLREIDDYLCKKEVATTVREEVLARLVKEKLVDDLQFAEAFVRDRMNHSTKGPQIIAKELHEKGVAQRFITESLAQFTEKIQYENAYNWARKRVKRHSKHSVRKRQEQIKTSLAQKGFSLSIANEISKDIREYIDDSGEFDKILHHGERLRKRYERRHEGYELTMRLRAALYQRGFQNELITKYIEQISDEDM